MSSDRFIVTEHRLAGQHIREYPEATANEQEDVLYVEVKQYRPRDNLNPKPGDVTIIGAHATGFPKVWLQRICAPWRTATRSSTMTVQNAKSSFSPYPHDNPTNRTDRSSMSRCGMTSSHDPPTTAFGSEESG